LQHPSALLSFGVDSEKVTEFKLPRVYVVHAKGITGAVGSREILKTGKIVDGETSREIYILLRSGVVVNDHHAIPKVRLERPFERTHETGQREEILSEPEFGRVRAKL